VFTNDENSFHFRSKGNMLTFHIHPSLSLLWISLLFRTVMAGYSPASLQSGPDLAGSSFAASTIYDPTTHTALITGTTYGRYFTGNGKTTISELPRETSNCFLATVALPSSKNPIMQWKILQTLGNDDDNADEACSSAVYHKQHKKLIVTGQSEVDGFMHSQYVPSLAEESTQYGILIDLDVSPDGIQPFQLAGGRVLEDAKVVYPVMAATAPLDDWIYVASQETGNTELNQNGLDLHTNTIVEIANEFDPMRFFKYGSNYRLYIRRLKANYTTATDTLHQTFSAGWRQGAATSDNKAVHLGGMIEIGNNLIVVGSTTGIGDSFGGLTASLGDDDMNGFMTKFDKNSGSPVKDSTEEIHTKRVESIDGRDDWIVGVCNDPQDPNHFYVVGATQGQLDTVAANENDSTRAFIMKVTVAMLETVWTQELRSDNAAIRTHVRGVSCAVSLDGTAVWLGGVVQQGAVLENSGTTASFGGDDVFVAKYNTNGGAIQFLRQIGSKDDDALAMRGALAIDKDGNCVVVGNTYGDFYRVRGTEELEDEPYIANVFVTTISADGKIAYPVGHPEFKSVQPSAGYSEPTPPTSPSASRPSSPNHVLSGMIVGVVFTCVGMLALAMFIRRKTASNREVSTDRSKVIQFLNAFDVEDIDLKHSATGGWHCSYSNDLARGRNRRSERGSVFGNLAPLERSMVLSSSGSDSLLTAPLTDNSLLQDSLFMDDDDTSSEYGGGLGGRFRESRPAHRNGYGGLIDAYNSSWDGRRSEHEASDVWGKEIL
jgi:hypothetical protein